MPTAELLYREEDATPVSTDVATLKPWSLARECLEAVPKVWLSTARADGRPHAAPVHVVWSGDSPCFTTRPRSRKARNLAGDPRCVITAAGADLDLVIEGDAERLRGEAALRQVAAAFMDKYSWPLAVRGSEVHEDSLPGSPEFGFYRVTPVRAFGYGADGMTATRWRFG
jgi:nitroimidazol reductase NimA-like FMN-containing flavoprotein (pyridoxamine 5'-phosphate oxidase superfamily)